MAYMCLVYKMEAKLNLLDMDLIGTCDFRTKILTQVYVTSIGRRVSLSLACHCVNSASAESLF